MSIGINRCSPVTMTSSVQYWKPWCVVTVSCGAMLYFWVPGGHCRERIDQVKLL